MTTTKQLVLDIAMNLNRIGNWAADGFETKQKRIVFFLEQTNAYITLLQSQHLPPPFIPTFNTFTSTFKKMYTDGLSTPKDKVVWAESMMTWGNILTHRASLIE